MFEDLRFNRTAEWLNSSPVADAVAMDKNLPLDTKITLIEVYGRMRGVILNRLSVRVYVEQIED